ncbi:Always early, putative isoform 3 [Hibiscus syriacus]|uniref:Always early, putative isoform 3 n=1 Tax=Hibiscus syriacus TaxID=106335 RepID=A0A6A3BI47_HIBSY|nr:Always early, putative isoform 3 [Hibiscus syriacus]
MAPSRKSKSVNKKFSYVNEVLLVKMEILVLEVGNGNLSDMLGPQWTKEELERFYEAYRKYGKDWKKMAHVLGCYYVHNRSMEMVEALYTMNRAYLSLPEGTASVVGLIAMMTDHYSVMVYLSSSLVDWIVLMIWCLDSINGEWMHLGNATDYGIEGGSDSEQESNEGMGVSLKPQKRSRGKLRDQPSKSLEKPLLDLLKFHSSASSCMSLLKRRRSEVGPVLLEKGLPVFLFLFLMTKAKGKGFSPIRQGMKLKADSVDDDVAHEVALALTEASQRGGSPQVLGHQIEKQRHHHLPSTNADSETTSAKHGSEVDEDACELSLGSTEADNADYAREKNYSRNIEGTDTVEVQQKVEDTSFDALQTLADLSLMMPETAPDTKSSVQFKEDKNEVEKTKLKGIILFLERKAMPPKHLGMEKNLVTMFMLFQKQRRKHIWSQIPKYENDDDSQLGESPNIEISNEAKNLLSKGKRSNNIGHPKQGKPLRPPEHASSSSDKGRDLNNSAPSTIQVSSVNQVNLPTKVRSKRKMDAQKPAIRKDIQSSDNIVKGKTSVPVTLFHDRALNLKEKLCNFLNSYLARRWCIFEWFYSTIDYPWFAKQEFVEYLDHVGLGIPRLTRVEWGVIRSSLGKPRRFSEQFLKEEREKLNQYRESVRRHYAELCAGTGEGLPTDLARPLSVGQRVIAIHPKTWEIHDGSVLTVDYGRYRIQFDNPELGVEFVMAEALGGSLDLFCLNTRVDDIDCMPLNPLENLPASLLRQNDAIFVENYNELKMNGQSKENKMEENIKFAQCDNLENANSPSRTSPSTFVLAICHSQLSNEFTAFALSLAQAREADVEALSQLTRALDKKCMLHNLILSRVSNRGRVFGYFGFTVIAAIADAIAAVAGNSDGGETAILRPKSRSRTEAVVSELRCMNGEVLENQKGGDNYLKDSDSFKKQYAAVLLQLNEVSSALFCLRQRNTYQGTSLGKLLKPLAKIGEQGSQLSSFGHAMHHVQESVSHVTEIVESSKRKARSMVDAAMQAMSSLRKGGKNIEVIEAIDFVNNQLSLDEISMPVPRSAATTDSIRSHDHRSYPFATSHIPEMKLQSLSDQDELGIPSDLISHCVATLLMNRNVQKDSFHQEMLQKC